MPRQEQGDDIDYEVSQEQLDAVDRMLEELDMDEQLDRVPAAFQIVERFEQQRQQEQAMSMQRANGDHIYDRRDGGSEDIDMDRSEENPDHLGMQQDDEDEDEEEYDSQPIGYIPLDQGDDDGDTDEDEDEEDRDQDQYHTMQSEDEGSTGDSQASRRRHEREDRDSDQGDFKDSGNDGDDDDDGQGYDGYLHLPLQNGNVPVPVIPSAIEIEIEQNDAAAEKIPDEDLQTIAQVMNSFSLPAPDWARSIPEERWLPKIVQQATRAPDRD